MPDELKPCPNPWCKSENLTIIWDLYRRHVVCKKCDLVGPGSAVINTSENTLIQTELDKQAIAAWNTRTPDPVAVAKAMRDMCAEAVWNWDGDWDEGQIAEMVRALSLTDAIERAGKK